MQQFFWIKEPIWKDRSVGIAIDKLSGMKLDEEIHIGILYKDKAGNYTYPWLYKVSVRTLLVQPIMLAKNSVRLARIKLEDCEETCIPVEGGLYW
jgi:hypothetical protein